MRESFNRIEDGQSLHVEVDVNAFAYSQKFNWLFSVFIKFDALATNQAGYEEFIETKEALIIALEYGELAKYVGMRIVDGWSEFYFYTSVSKGLNNSVSKMLNRSEYIYESSVVRDTKWDFYQHNLYPSELEFCHIQSEKIIFLLQEEEDDLSVVREVEHYLSFDTPTQKNRFVDNLHVEGFSYKDDISSDEFENGVALVKKQSVTPDEVQKTVEELFHAVKKEGGYYEGWSTVLAQEVE